MYISLSSDWNLFKFHHFQFLLPFKFMLVLSSNVSPIFFSCSKILSPPRHLPFFANPSFLPSPEKSFQLPVYAKLMANTFASENCNPRLAWVRSHDPRVMQFTDISADESTSHTSSDDTSSNSSSMEAIV
jgi:hypothetical protein